MYYSLKIAEIYLYRKLILFNCTEVVLLKVLSYFMCKYICFLNAFGSVQFQLLVYRNSHYTDN